MNGEEQKPSQQKSRGYGKRPMWQWVVLYLVIAVIVYGLIYLFFIKDGSGGGPAGY